MRKKVTVLSGSHSVQCISVSSFARCYCQETGAGNFHAVEVFNSLQSEKVIWKGGILGLPVIAESSLELMHDILEGLTALEMTVRQKPLITASFTGRTTPPSNQ